MENIKFIKNKIDVDFIDTFKKINSVTGNLSKMRITRFFDNGTAIHITLDEEQLAYLKEKLDLLNPVTP